MKKIKFLSLAAVTICLASCGSGTNSEESKDQEAIVLTPETTHVKGDLGDYFEVVEKEYTTTDSWNGDKIVSIEVKRTDVEYAIDLKGVEPYGYYGQGIDGHVGFGIEILDDNGNVIKKVAATASGLGGMYDGDDMKEAIKLKAGETATVRWSFDFDDDAKPAKFRLSSAYEKSESSDTGSSSSSSSTKSSSNSSEWDELLSSYEKYVDDCVSLIKKANSGDMSAMAEYTSVLSDAQDVCNELNNAKGELTTAQASKLAKISAKLANAAL